MTHSNSYYMLVASLPHLEPLFSTRQTPIARLKLDQRLALLESEVVATLAQIKNLLLWGRLTAPTLARAAFRARRSLYLAP